MPDPPSLSEKFGLRIQAFQNLLKDRRLCHRLVVQLLLDLRQPGSGTADHPAGASKTWPCGWGKAPGVLKRETQRSLNRSTWIYGLHIATLYPQPVGHSKKKRRYRQAAAAWPALKSWNTQPTWGPVVSARRYEIEIGPEKDWYFKMVWNGLIGIILGQ